MLPALGPRGLTTGTVESVGVVEIRRRAAIYELNSESMPVTWRAASRQQLFLAMNTTSQNLLLSDHLAAWMLLGVLAVVLLLVFIFAALMLNFARRRRLEGAVLLRPAIEQPFGFPPPGVRSFIETPSRWLAVRSTRTEEVQAALHLANPIPCPLVDGLTSAAELELFISPPIRGWILVTGSEVPDPADDVDACFVWLRGLSQQLGEIQYFAADRALGHHAWARLLSGEVFRAFAWVDETVWTQGELTRAEMDLGMKCPGYGEMRGDVGEPRDADCSANVEKVPLLAARWSIDPASIDLGRQWPRPGITGQFSPH